MGDKFSEEEKQSIDEIVREGLQFLESNTDAEAAEYEAKQKAIEAKFNPIMQKIYQQGAPTGPADDMRGDPGAAHAAPEEVPVDDPTDQLSHRLTYDRIRIVNSFLIMT